MSRGITAGELMDKLRSDPEWVAKEKTRSDEAERRKSRSIAEQQPIIADLHTVGVAPSSLGQLLNSEKIDARAVPVLLKHLALEYSDGIRAALARCLAIKGAAYAWDFIVDAYKKEPLRCGARDSQTKDGLAVALAATMAPEKMSELLDLLADRSLGPSRVLLLRPLRRRVKNDAVREALEKLVSDPDLEKEIKAWKINL